MSISRSSSSLLLSSSSSPVAFVTCLVLTWLSCIQPALSVKQSTDYSNTPSTLNVLYIEPADIGVEVQTLNEKSTLGNSYKKGWILPSMQPLSVNIYLYYDNVDESRIRPFVKPSILPLSDSSSASAAASSSSQQQVIGSNTSSIVDPTNNNQNKFIQHALYLFFTTEKNCFDYLQRNTWPVEIVERIAPNMYKAQMTNLVLTYSDDPLHICMQQVDNDDNILDSNRLYAHQGNDYWVSIVTTRNLIPLWLRISLFFVLLTLSGLFSGLNLGLMSLDVNELETLKRIGTPNEQSYADKIYPLRKRGNFLLCTILLGNVLVNSVSTLLLGDMLSGVYAALGSTILIVIFGEIIPQAACSKHGLAVGAYTRYVMYVFMVLTSPLSFPLSIILDKVLGQEIVATYNREKLRELMLNVEDLDDKEKKIITGALDFNKRKVKEVMTKLEDVFMMEINSRLDFEAIARIAQEGFSRIPVYQGTRENVVGLLHVKDFTLLDPDDNMPVRALLEFYSHTVITCDAEKPIDEMFEEFRKGETHLAFVTDILIESDRDPVQTCVGIVTLEDILEALVQMEIYDEFDDKEMAEKEEEAQLNAAKNGDRTRQKSDSTDQMIQMNSINEKSSSGKQITFEINETSLDQSASKSPTSQTAGGANNTTTSPHYESQTSKDFSFFLQQQKDSSQRALISPQVRFVMFQFLSTTVKPFTSEFLTKNVLELLFKRATIKESRRMQHASDSKSQQPAAEYLYRYNKGCNYFILILSGEAIIEVGQEKLEFPAGPFAYFGVNALLGGRETPDQILQEDTTANPPTHHYYVPDFSLRVEDKCVYLKIDRDLWRNGVIKSNYERLNNRLSVSIEYIPTDDHHMASNLDLTNNNNNNSITSSPQQQLQLKKLKENSANTTPSLNYLKPGRRSTITESVLSKAQEMANSLSKINHHPSTYSNTIVEVDDNVNLLSSTDDNNKLNDTLQTSGEIRPIDDDAESEPFLTQRSTFSLNDKKATASDTRSINKLPDKNDVTSLKEQY